MGLSEGIAGSSLTGIGVAKGAGMHWAFDKSGHQQNQGHTRSTMQLLKNAK